jgi:D-alanyl-D-alanine carboxypeptidase
LSCLPIERGDPATDRFEGGVSGNVRTGEWGINLTQKIFDSRAAGRVALGLVSVFAVMTVTLLPAEARHFRAKVATHPHEQQHESSPSYAAIVVDGNSGNVLHSASADELRHPASLTKIMTLYLLFERLESGKLKLDSQLPVSEHASVQAPTKLGLKPGQTIAVEDAIKGLVTKSANDAAVVVAEALGGTESDFAEMMTKKAHALGMSRTAYHNASGLPNDEQVTTARDQALLGRAIQERFPHQYRYFSTQSFTYHGETMGNHNHLLGHVEGVDGIKTGYTQASGFNLVTSVHRNNRFIVAVVLGGASAGARDAKMRSLIEEHIAAASTQHTVAAIVEGAAAKVATRAGEAKPEARPTKTASAPGPGWPASKFAAPAADNSPTGTATAKAVAQAAEDDIIKPIPVKTVKVKLTQSAGLGPIITPVETIAEPMVAAAMPPKAVAPTPKAIAAARAPVATTPVASAAPAPAALAPAVVAAAPAAPVGPAVVAAAPAAPVAPVAPVVAVAAPASAPPAVEQSVAAVALPKAPAPAVKTASMTLASVASTPIAAAPVMAAPAMAAPVAAAPVAPAPVAEAVPAAPAPKAAVPALKSAAKIVAGLTRNDVAPVAPPSAEPVVSAPVVSAPVAPAPVASAPIADPTPAAPPKWPATPKAIATAPVSAVPVQAAPAAWKPMPVAAAEANAPEAKHDAPARSAQTHGGWIIQIGAFDAEHDAQQKLSVAQAKIGHVLDRADPFTEPVMKGDKTLYRARFAGFPQKDDAEAVCKQLKRNDIECMTIKN